MRRGPQPPQVAIPLHNLASSEAAPARRQADCDYYHRVRAAGLSVHGCYAGRVYDMAVVAPGLPEGGGYDRDAALAALVRPGASRPPYAWASLQQPAPHLLGMQTALVFRVNTPFYFNVPRLHLHCPWTDNGSDTVSVPIFRESSSARNASDAWAGAGRMKEQPPLAAHAREPALRLGRVRGRGRARAQDASADGWRILEDYRVFLTSRSQETTAATEAVRNRWRNEARSPLPLCALAGPVDGVGDRAGGMLGAAPRMQRQGTLCSNEVAGSSVGRGASLMRLEGVRHPVSGTPALPNA